MEETEIELSKKIDEFYFINSNEFYGWDDRNLFKFSINKLGYKEYHIFSQWKSGSSSKAFAANDGLFLMSQDNKIVIFDSKNNKTLFNITENDYVYLLKGVFQRNYMFYLKGTQLKKLNYITGETNLVKTSEIFIDCYKGEYDPFSNVIVMWLIILRRICGI